LGVALSLCVEFGEVETRTFRRAGEMVAEMPVLHAAPDELRRFVAEGEAFTTARGRLTQPCQAIDIGLFGGDLARRDILDYGVGPRRAEGDAVELRDAEHVTHRVAQPVGMVALKKVWLADCERINGTQIDFERVARGERAVAPDCKIGIRRSKRPEKVGGEIHGGYPAHIAAGCKRSPR